VIRNIAPDIPLRDVVWGVMPFVGLHVPRGLSSCAWYPHRHMAAGHRDEQINRNGDMADIEIHRGAWPRAQGRARAADEMAAHLGKKFGLTGQWTGNVLKFERPGVAGSLAITDKDLDLAVSLGFLLKAMKGSIEQSVRHELDKLSPRRRRRWTSPRR
jgi:putative polyhydroxyalkanoate system protein